MTDNCSKGEPPDVENCTLLNFRKKRQTSEAVVPLNDLLYFAVSVDGETIRQESVPFDSAKDALSFYECFKNNPKYEDKKLKIAKIVEYTEI